MNEIRRLIVEELIPKNIYILTIFQDGMWLCQYIDKKNYYNFRFRFFHITGQYKNRDSIIPLIKKLIDRSYISHVEKFFFETADYGFYYINEIHNYTYFETRYDF
jgi:hypothetical protein